MSSRCCGRSPSGPAADPAGKDLIALDMSVSVTCMEPNCVGSGGQEKSEGTGGWRCFKASRVAASTAAGFSSEHEIRAAARILPSSILALTAAASVFDSSRLERRGNQGPDVWDGVPSSALFFNVFATLCLRPALGGANSIDWVKSSSVRQVDRSLVLARTRLIASTS
jgi:hypothetical protein